MGTGDGGDQRGDEPGSRGSLQVEGAAIKNLLDLKECVEDSPSFRSETKHLLTLVALGPTSGGVEMLNMARIDERGT